MWAANNGKTITVKILLEHGADVNNYDYQGKFYNIRILLSLLF